MSDRPRFDWDARTLGEGVELFRELALAEPAMRAELAASAREYFRGAAPVDATTPAGRSAERRHLEWFLFERPGGASEGRPAERLLGTWCQRAPKGWADGVDTFLNSHASMFEVVAVEPGRGAELRDLAGLGRFAVEEPEASQVFQSGDLVVGRLYPVDGRHRISSAAGFFRNPELLTALERDLERARESRRHAVLRVAQPELEAMFFGAGAPVDPPDPVGDARRFLAESGLEPERVEAILGAFAGASLPAETLVPGANDLLGEVLEQLAFHTEIDLARARELLLAAWAAMSAAAMSAATPAPERTPHEVAPEPPPKKAPSSAVERAILEFDRDRAGGMDLERSFEKLERSLGLDESSAGDEDPGPAPDFPGVVGAVIEEFLWEVGRLEGEDAARELEPLRALGEFAAKVGVIENLRARDLLTFATFWLPERRLLRSAREATAMVRALGRFCDWVDEAQSLELAQACTRWIQGLERSLPRVARANLALERERAAAREEDPGRLFELRAADAQGTLWLVDGGGAELVAHVPAELAADLRPGDRLRVRVELEREAVLAVYPPEAAELVERS